MVDLAREAFDSNNFKLSAEIYERVIRSDGPKIENLLGLADSQARAGQLDKALSTYIKCVRLGNISPANMRQFATGLADFISQNGAELGLIPPFCHNPFDAFVCGMCSGLLIEPMTYPCGHSYCHACLQKDKTKTCRWCGVVHYFLDIHNFKINVTLWQIIKKFFHVEIEAARLRSEGNELFTRRQFDKAIAMYTKAAEKAPLDHLIISNRSHAYAALNHFKEALDDAELIIKLKPDWAKGYYRKGVSLSGLSRHEEAAVAYLQCLALDPAADTATEALAKELHFLVNLCSEADGKHAEIQKTLGVSPNQLLLNILPSYTGVVEAQKSAPASRVSSPTRLGAKSVSDENLAVDVADCLDQSRLGRDRGSKGRPWTPLTASNELEISRYQLAFDPSRLHLDDVECSLCFRLLFQPIATPCGHVFCRGCLDRCLDHSTNCPLCKSSLTDHLAERRQATVDAIEKIIEICLPQELAQRKSGHEEEISAITGRLKDGKMEVPVFVCTMGVPGQACPLHIFEPRYRLMVRRAMETGDRQFAMCIHTGSNEGEFADYGVILEIRDVQYFPDGRSLVDTICGARIRVLSRGVRDGYNTAVVEYVIDQRLDETQFQVMSEKCREVYSVCRGWFESLNHVHQRQICEQFGEFPREDRLMIDSENGPKWLWWMVSVLPLNPRAQLSFLQMTSLQDRLTGVSNVVKFMTRQSGR